MSRLVDRSSEIEKIVLHQLNQFWTDVDKEIIHDSIPDALESIQAGFTDLQDLRFFNNNEVVFSSHMSVHWMIFLYRLSHAIFKKGGGITADYVYYLNKIMHSNDWLYAIDLPIHFLCEHPICSVLGRAKYGDYLFVYQGTTIGGNRSHGELIYPTIGNNVILYANATILGKSHVGNNVVFSANTYCIDEEIPDNCIVFGHSPNIIIKEKNAAEIKEYTQHIWGWK